MRSRFPKSDDWVWIPVEGKAPVQGLLQPVDGEALSLVRFIRSRRKLRTKYITSLTSGDVIETFGEKLIVGLHASRSLRYRSWHCFEATDQVSWQRPQAGITDAATGLQRPGSPQELGPIWISIEMMPGEESGGTTRIDEQRFIYIAPLGIELTDRLNGFEVRKIDRVFGLDICEVY